ncbi:WD40 repeat domain-containing protein [Lentzea sp.]|uniref:WD40 repeat domain-containing protein n=1 Tax=Lentzea sp. TaxID=56099 RepID=UPI002BA734F0|nr:WD40 repeat domain-containing protein [Lentzea sp.]HUQ57463.1 WD40 repeat domain-containing protein [Lentzea sp.]
MGRRERPIDPGEGPVQRFAWELRQLREKAGSPNYRTLAQRAHYSATALSQAAAGEQLPSLAVALAYVQACEGDVAQWEQRWRQAAKGEDDSTPYLGLTAFGICDADRFFGRDELAADIVGRIRRQRVVGVFGPSGSGKSSLVHAGVLPALTDWTVLTATPTTWRGGQADLVVVDQFEELFTHFDSAVDRESFVASLLDDGKRVLLTVRADFLGHCATVPALVEALRDAQVLVGPMTDDELRAAVEQPAVRAGLKVQPDMLAAVMADVRGQPGALPLLSHALLETWRRRDRGRLTLDGYRASGGVAGAVAATAESTYAELSVREQAVARAVLLRLVQTHDDVTDLRRRAPLDEVMAAGRPADTAHVVNVLANARLIVVADGVVELAHEALVRAWPRLRKWIDDDRESLRLHRDFTTAATAWQAAGRDPGELYRGARLAAMRELSGRIEWPMSSNELEREFLQAALDEESASRQAADQQARRLRTLVKSLAVLTVACLAVASVAVVQGTAAVREQQVAESRQIAVQAQDLSASWPDAAGELAVEAYRTSATAEARGALLSTAAYKPARTVLKDHRGPVRAIAFSADSSTFATAGDDHSVLLRSPSSSDSPSVLAQHNGTVRALAFMPGGAVLVSAGEDKRIILWDTRTRLPLRTISLDSPIRVLVLTADGSTAAVATADGLISLWRTDDWTRTNTVVHELGEVHALSLNGSVLAAGGDKGTLVVENGITRTFADHSAAVRTVALSPDGRVLASGGDDYQVVLRVLATGKTSGLRRHVGGVHSVQFDATGTKVVSTSDDGSIRWWTVPDGGWLTGLITRTHPFYVAALSPDGAWFAAGGDESVSLWNQPLPPLTGHTSPPDGIALSPDGAVLATGGRDRMVLLWDRQGRQAGRIDVPAHVTALAFRSATEVVVADMRGVLSSWRTDGTPLRTWQGHQGAIKGLVVSGDRAVTGGADGAVVVWDLNSAGPGHPLPPGHSGPVNTVALLGDAVASGGADGRVLRWSGDQVEVVRETGPAVKSIAAVPGSDLLVVGDAGGEVALWGRGGRARTLFTGRGAIGAVTASKDGTTVAAAANDSLITLWRVAEGTQVATLTGHTGPVNAVLFDDGGDLTSSGPDPRVIRWELDPDQVIARLCASGC